MTTDRPLTWYEVAELSRTQNNYLSLELAMTPAEHNRGLLPTPSPTRCRQRIPGSRHRCRQRSGGAGGLCSFRPPTQRTRNAKYSRSLNAQDQIRPRCHESKHKADLPSLGKCDSEFPNATDFALQDKPNNSLIYTTSCLESG